MALNTRSKQKQVSRSYDYSEDDESFSPQTSPTLGRRDIGWNGIYEGSSPETVQKPGFHGLTDDSADFSSGDSPQTRSSSRLRNTSPATSSRRREVSVEKIVRNKAKKVTFFPSEEAPMPTAKWGLIPISVFILFVIAILSKYLIGNFVEENSRTKVIKNCTALNKLFREFPPQDEDFWRIIKKSVESVLKDEPPQPTVMVFVHDNPKIAEKLITKVTRTTHSCFMEAKDEPLLLRGKDFDRPEMIADYGLAIEKYRRQIEHSVVMFVHSIEDIPGEVVQAFHTFCDKQTPMVDRSIYLFTLELKSAKNLAIGEIYDLVEDTLTEKWSKYLPRNKIQPLLSRMTETVLYLKTE